MKPTILVLAFILSVAPAPFALATFGSSEPLSPLPTAGCTDEAPQAAEETAPAEHFIVRNPQGVALGEIVNFVVDTDLGKVAYALLDTGGAMAVEDFRLVPVSALQVENETIILNMNEQQLAGAPLPNQGLEVEEFHRRLADYFGVAPYWEE